MDNIAAAGRDETDEEGEVIVEHEEDEEDEGDPQDTEGRQTSQARLRDAFEQDERAGYWGGLLERATARSQWLRGGRESENETVEDDGFTWREGDGLWEIGCRVCVQFSGLFRVLINILDRTRGPGCLWDSKALNHNGFDLGMFGHCTPIDARTYICRSLDDR